MEMNPEVKPLWLTALKGGKYEQGTGGLQNTDGQFCCLGVLCDIAPFGEYIDDQDGFGPRFFPEGEEGDNSWNNQSSYPGKEVNKWAGIDNSIGQTLAQMNDSGSTFEQIAEWIDTNL